MREGWAVFLGLVVLVGTGVAHAGGKEQLTVGDVERAVGLLPRGFVANQGQWDGRAAFAAPGFFGTTWVTREGELRHVLVAGGECGQEEHHSGTARWGRHDGRCASRRWVLSERFLGGRVGNVEAREALEGKVSYFLGNDPARHRSGLATCRYLELGKVYPAVRVRLSATQRTVEKVFEVLPGGDVGRIAVEVGGANGLRVSGAGELVVATGYGEVVMSRPVAWQEVGGGRVEVAVAYRVDASRRRYGFAVGEYDRSQPLWIDPILQATYPWGARPWTWRRPWRSTLEPARCTWRA